MVGDESRQIVHAPQPVVTTQIDLRSLPATEREAEARRQLREFARQPFALERDPQLRAAVARLDDDDHVIALVSHHIASDGWSGNIVLRELGALYDGFRTGTSREMPPLAVQFADFAAWQRQSLAGERLDQLLTYWRRQLDGAETQLDLPTDRARPAATTFEGAVTSTLLSPAATERLRTLIQESGATSFMVFLAGLYVLLGRYGGVEEIVVGTPVAGRALPELEGVVGFFTNTLLLRGSLAGNPTFRELLDRVRTTTLGAFDHQEIPLELLLHDRGPSGKATAVAPQVMLLTEDPDRASFALPGTTSVPFGISRGATKFDLTFHLAETPAGLRISAQFRSDLFDTATIERMSQHFGMILESAIDAPDTPVQSLPMMRAAEHRQVTEGFRGATVDYPADETLLDLIEQQCARSPDAVAVADEARTLTHAQLHERADALARWLRAEGIGIGSLVGVCLERSVDMVVALVAVLKAGAAYVPLDPEYPADRLAFMLEDAAMPVLLTEQRVAATLPSGSAKTLLLDTEWDHVTAAASSSTSSATVRPRATDTAYMIYTSGSTGRPKGALNSHRGIVNRLLWMQDEYRLTAADVVLQKTPFSFDVSVWEFFWPLMSGARLIMARPGGHRDPGYLADVIVARGVTVSHFVPSMLRAFLEDRAAPAVVGTLRKVMCSGEALSLELARRFFDLLPGVELHNLYGPTEAAVDVSYWACRADESQASVPIGRPVANTRLYVLDARREAVPIGVPGELFIAGVQVGLGYHNRPDLTAERFVPDAFAPAPARMYATGDRARWRQDGVLEYLGRLDHQVKLRGHRIELAEIEAALMQQPGVADAIAMIREDSPGDQRLIGYVVADSDAAPSSADLRAQLRAKLPAIMIPTAIVVMERFPLTPNGKADRKALPPPAGGSRVAQEQFTAPATPLEEEIAGIWSAKLGVTPIGMHDDFFDLGGNSLLAMRMIAEIERIWGRRLSFETFFERPTVATVVAVLVSTALQEEEGGIAVLQGDGPGTPLVFAHGDVLGYGWYCRRLAPLLGKAPLYVLPTLGPDNGSGSVSTEAIAAAHITSLRRIQPHGPYRLGGFCYGALVVYEMARQLTAQGETIERVVLIDAFCSNLRFRNFEPVIRLITGARDALKHVLQRRAQILPCPAIPRPSPPPDADAPDEGTVALWLAGVVKRNLGLTKRPRPTTKHACQSMWTDSIWDRTCRARSRIRARSSISWCGPRGPTCRHATMAASNWCGPGDAMAVRPWLSDRGGWEGVASNLGGVHTVAGSHVDMVTPAGLPRIGRATPRMSWPRDGAQSSATMKFTCGA